VDKYEFRTQGRDVQTPAVRNDSMLQRWADGLRKDVILPLKPRAMTA
jgi:hypothetical protein